MDKELPSHFNELVASFINHYRSGVSQLNCFFRVYARFYVTAKLHIFSEFL